MASKNTSVYSAVPNSIWATSAGLGMGYNPFTNVTPVSPTSTNWSKPVGNISINQPKPTTTNTLQHGTGGNPTNNTVNTPTNNIPTAPQGLNYGGNTTSPLTSAANYSNDIVNTLMNSWGSLLQPAVDSYGSLFLAETTDLENAMLDQAQERIMRDMSASYAGMAGHSSLPYDVTTQLGDVGKQMVFNRTQLAQQAANSLFGNMTTAAQIPYQQAYQLAALGQNGSSNVMQLLASLFAGLPYNAPVTVAN